MPLSRGIDKINRGEEREGNEECAMISVVMRFVIDRSLELGFAREKQ